MNAPQITGIICALYIVAVHCGAWRLIKGSGQISTFAFQAYLVAVGGVVWSLFCWLFN